MILPKLTICICTVPARHPLLSRMLERLYQPRVEEVEILISMDAGHKPTGVKRNQLVARATGDYIVHLDDDDLVSETYLAKVLAAIDESSPDVVLIRCERTDLDDQVKPVVFDYHLTESRQAETIDDVMWRSPGHLCPMRASIARSVSFPIVEPEDLRWADMIRPQLRSAARAGSPDEILYHYLWHSKKINRWQPLPP